MFYHIDLEAMLFYDLETVLEVYQWQSKHKYGTCMMVLWHILAVLCEMSVS
jgi:hypothetical protein